MGGRRSQKALIGRTADHSATEHHECLALTSNHPETAYHGSGRIRTLTLPAATKAEGKADLCGGQRSAWKDELVTWKCKADLSAAARRIGGPVHCHAGHGCRRLWGHFGQSCCVQRSCSVLS